MAYDSLIDAEVAISYESKIFAGIIIVMNPEYICGSGKTHSNYAYNNLLQTANPYAITTTGFVFGYISSTNDENDVEIAAVSTSFSHKAMSMQFCEFFRKTQVAGIGCQS